MPRVNGERPYEYGRDPENIVCVHGFPMTEPCEDCAQMRNDDPPENLEPDDPNTVRIRAKEVALRKIYGVPGRVLNFGGSLTGRMVVNPIPLTQTSGRAIRPDGSCPWCPVGCPECPGTRADCECYRHQPDAPVSRETPAETRRAEIAYNRFHGLPDFAAPVGMYRLFPYPARETPGAEADWATPDE